MALERVCSEEVATYTLFDAYVDAYALQELEEAQPKAANPATRAASKYVPSFD